MSNKEKIDQFVKNHFEIVTPLKEDQRQYFRDIISSLMTQAEFIERQSNALKLKCNRVLGLLIKK